MRSTFLRRLLLALAVLVPSGLAASRVAHAEDDTNPLTADPETFCSYSSFDVALASEALPKDWKLLEGDAAGPEAKALEAAIVALAKDKGVASSDAFHVEMRTVAGPEAAKLLYALYDLGDASPTFADALKAEAAKQGWVVREMGTPRHGLVVAAPEALRAKAVAVATAWGSKILSIRASGSLESAMGARAIALSRVALAIDEKNASAHLIVGLMAKEFALRAEPRGDLDPAISHLRAALAKDASNPLGARDATIARGNLGSAILNKGGPSEEARDALKEAVKTVSEVSREEGIGYRYDLACAHARLKEIEPAFALLTAVLEDHAKEPVNGISAWRKDPDFENLKADPRWKKLLETYGESDSSDN